MAPFAETQNRDAQAATASMLVAVVAAAVTLEFGDALVPSGCRVAASPCWGGA
jgi:hypothetical protein